MKSLPTSPLESCPEEEVYEITAKHLSELSEYVDFKSQESSTNINEIEQIFENATATAIKELQDAQNKLQKTLDKALQNETINTTENSACLQRIQLEINKTHEKTTLKLDKCSTRSKDKQSGLHAKYISSVKKAESVEKKAAQEILKCSAKGLNCASLDFCSENSILKNKPKIDSSFSKIDGKIDDVLKDQNKCLLKALKEVEFDDKIVAQFEKCGITISSSQSSESNETTEEPTEAPEVTDNTEEPEVTEQPETPQGSEAPHEPQNTVAPQQPEEPQVTEAPQQPEEPQNTEEPRQPENPEVTQQPEEPQNTKAPQQPEEPQNPQESPNSEIPQEPQNPEATQEPEVSQPQENVESNSPQ